MIRPVGKPGTTIAPAYASTAAAWPEAWVFLTAKDGNDKAMSAGLQPAVRAGSEWERHETLRLTLSGGAHQWAE